MPGVAEVAFRLWERRRAGATPAERRGPLTGEHRAGTRPSGSGQWSETAGRGGNTIVATMLAEDRKSKKRRRCDCNEAVHTVPLLSKMRFRTLIVSEKSADS